MIKVQWSKTTNIYSITDLELNEPNMRYTPGYKLDNHKPTPSDIPKDALFDMSQAFGYGAKKYEKYNYRKGMKVTRQLDAAIRHIYQFLDGEDLDKENGQVTSGASHLGHAMASIAMALYSWKNVEGMDDRFEGDLKKHRGHNDD